MKIQEAVAIVRDGVFPDGESEFGKTTIKDEANAVLAAAYLALHREDDGEQSQGGPISAEFWRLDELIAQLEKWKRVASGQTCVSFECLCYGASSLWHKTHRDNFRKIDRKPEELSRWVLDNANGVYDDFPKQVLGILQNQKAEIEKLRHLIRGLGGEA